MCHRVCALLADYDIVCDNVLQQCVHVFAQLPLRKLYRTALCCADILRLFWMNTVLMWPATSMVPMASLLDLESKFLECHICLETYCKPRTIPCLHSFCELCLNDYIASCREVQEQGHFPCPVCKQVVDVPDPNLPRDRWAASFKTSFFLNELADCLKQVSSSSSGTGYSPTNASKISCALCGREWAPTVCIDCNTRMCRECGNVHGNIPSSVGHQVIDWEAYNSTTLHRQKSYSCPKHADRSLDLYCPLCCVPICQLCHINFHKLCSGVASLSQAAQKKRLWLEELEGRTNNYIDKLTRINTILNRTLDKAEMLRVTDAEHLKEFFIKTMHMLHKKQEELLAKLQATYTKHTRALCDDKRDREELLTALVNARDLTRSLAGIGSDWDVMKEADADLERQVQGLISRVEKLAQPQTPLSGVSLDEAAVRGITMHLNELKLHVGLSSPVPTTPSSPMPEAPFPILAHLGSPSTSAAQCLPSGDPAGASASLPLCVSTSAALSGEDRALGIGCKTAAGIAGFSSVCSQTRPRPKSVPSAEFSSRLVRTPRLLKRIKTRTGLDQQRPDIWDLVVMPRGAIILVDNGNQCLKGMNMGPSASGSTVCRLPLQSPLRACRLSEKEVAVSGQDKKLYVIKVSVNKLEATRLVNTPHEYWGLGAILIPGEDTRLAASCPDQASVHILDLHGRILAEISRDASQSPLFQRPGYLTVTPDGELLVSDPGKRCIFRANVGGAVRFKYPCDGPFGISNPRGLAVDYSGNVLVVDKGGQQVVRLTASGRYAGGLLGPIHGLSFPEAIAVGPNGVVYVTSDTPQSDSQDILVFEIV